MRAIRNWGAFAAGVLFVLTLALLMAPSGGLPSRPKFQTVTARAPRTNAEAPFFSTSTSPAYRWQKTDAAAGEGLWEISTSGNSQLFRTLDDTGAAIENWLTVTRVGTDATNISFSPIVNGTNAAIAFFASSVTPKLYFDDTDAAADEGTWRCDASDTTFQCSTRTDADGAGNNFLQATRSGTTISTVNLTGTAIQGNGVDLTPSTGEFVASFTDACTVTPTATIDWARVGNLVTLQIELGSASCTGDSTGFDTDAGAPVPAAIRPSVSIQTAMLSDFIDGGTTISGKVQIDTGGNITMFDCGITSISCASGTWTASGNRQFPTGWTISYILGNP